MNEKSRKITRAQLDGFTMGLLAGAAVLNDVYDFDDDAIVAYFEDCKLLIESIAKKMDSPKYIIKELEKMTNVKLTFSGET